MSRPTITNGTLRARDGWSELVIEHDPDGRVRINVHDDSGPGNTATFGREASAVIAEFITDGEGAS
ncbi:hypothetical protein NONO_c59880 [Nocardia nova SH22a]|uniref:Uncharacterized protein n=1 Tax=Nocardia nova SH22a TaxID=1415166 RepID=W5TNM6_9NOCA|nr:hypothetical protein [Nocardia nova]AHH20764.1 hypothetical protein NONO_c59880 [Nocardia nova SH22a]